MTCNQDHQGEIPTDFPKVPTTQRGKWHNVCAGCAYLLGRHHAEQTEDRLWQLVEELEARVKQLRAK